MLTVGSILNGCGESSGPSGATASTATVVSGATAEASAADRSSAETPTLGSMTVTDGCAEVRLDDGSIWADSCLQAEPQPVAVRSETKDGVELALIRFPSEADLAETQPASVRFVQRDGWALVESATPDFTMSFRQAGVQGEAVCAYNPFFIDCDVRADDPGS